MRGGIYTKTNDNVPPHVSVRQELVVLALADQEVKNKPNALLHQKCQRGFHSVAGIFLTPFKAEA